MGACWGHHLDLGSEMQRQRSQIEQFEGLTRFYDSEACIHTSMRGKGGNTELGWLSFNTACQRGHLNH